MTFKRESYNIQILEELKDYFIKNPSIRFYQGLYHLGVIDKEDRFYEEPSNTLGRLRNRMMDEENEDFL